MPRLFSAPDAVSGPEAATPDARAPTPLPPAGAARTRSLRAWGAISLAALIVPFVGVIAADVALQRREAQGVAEREMERYARVLAREFDAIVRNHARLVDLLAERPEVRRAAESSCGPTFDEVGILRPEFASLALVGLDGRVICSASGAVPGGVTFDDRAWFRAVSRGATSFRDQPIRGKVSDRTVVPYAVAVPGAGGALGAILVSGIDLGKLKPVATGALDLPGDVALALVDADGDVLLATQAGASLGDAVGEDVVARLRRRETHWRGASTIADDTVVGAAALATVPWHAVALAPTRRVLAAEQARLERAFALALLLVAAATGIAIVLRHRIMRPIRALAQAAEGVASGDLALRVPETSRTTEFARIETGFNAMLERLGAEQAALLESEGRLRTILEAASEPVLVIDRRSVIRYASPASERVLGWSPDELVGRDLSLIQPARLAPGHAQGLAHHAATGERRVDWRAVETVARRRDGREIPVEISFGELTLDGEPGYAGFLRDVSARRDHERMLREREDALLRVLDVAPAMVWTSDAQGHTQYLSPRLLEYTGMAADDALGHGWLAYVHPEDRERLRALAASGVANPVEFTTEYRIRRADGAYRWFQDHGVPRRSAGGAFEGFIGCCVDIHARIDTERRLRRQTAAYEVLTDVNVAIAGATDPAALMQHVCDSIVAFGGMHAAWIHRVDEAGAALAPVARACYAQSLDALPAVRLDGDDPQEGAPILLAFRQGAPHVANDRAADPAVRAERGPALPAARSSCTLPILREGAAIGTLTVVAAEADVFDAELVDLMALIAGDVAFGLASIDERVSRSAAEDRLRALAVTLEERVAERTRSLEAANRELEAFSYSVSHDLRAPLRAIGGFTELALEGSGDAIDDTHRGYLERVLAASRRMSALINDLLDLSSVTRAEIRRSRVDVTAVAREVLAELAAGGGDRHVEAVVAPGLVVDADAGLLQTVLSNLVGNAWKFTSRTPAARIEVGATELDGQRAIYVRDNGTGFDMAHAHKLFAPFQRLHTEREFEGTGIGLALVQRIVARHGGRVVADAAPGRGATITVSFGARGAGS